MTEESIKGVEEAIHRIAESLHSEIRDMEGRHIAPCSQEGTSLRSLSHAVAALAWGADSIAHAIEDLAKAISQTHGRDE